VGTDLDYPDRGPDSVRHEALKPLLFAASTLASSSTPLWQRTACVELIDVLDLAARHGFALAEILREMLDSDLSEEPTRMLVLTAFEALTDSRLLAVLQGPAPRARLQEPRP
jgi:hypothetical protein